MRNAVRQANQVIYHCNADYDTTMVSTLASIVLYKRHLYLANAGDSRAYHYNEKMGLRQIRNIEVEQGQTSSLQIIPQDQTTTNYHLGQQYQVAIELSKRDLEIDDLILLCTNGLWHMLDDEHIQKILALGGDTQVLAYTLVEAANTAGGTGNISAIVVRVQ
jgi:serine/threonine protein phosphatase PrpC